MDTPKKRFGDKTEEEIDLEIDGITPANTKKSQACVWHQFTTFCVEKGYGFNEKTTPIELNIILKSWAVKMKRKNSCSSRYSNVNFTNCTFSFQNKCC